MADSALPWHVISPEQSRDRAEGGSLQSVGSELLKQVEIRQAVGAKHGRGGC